VPLKRRTVCFYFSFAHSSLKIGLCAEEIQNQNE